MKVSDVINELKGIYKYGVAYSALDSHLTEEDVERWIDSCGWSRSRFFDEVAKSLALGFNTSELSFEFCDAVVNDLFTPVVSTSGERPQIFWEVYSAFDEGEYYHGNNREEDPVDVYTRPMIARLVELILASRATSFGVETVIGHRATRT